MDRENGCMTSSNPRNCKQGIILNTLLPICCKPARKKAVVLSNLLLLGGSEQNGAAAVEKCIGRGEYFRAWDWALALCGFTVQMWAFLWGKRAVTCSYSSVLNIRQSVAVIKMCPAALLCNIWISVTDIRFLRLSFRSRPASNFPLDRTNHVITSALALSNVTSLTVQVFHPLLLPAFQL